MRYLLIVVLAMMSPALKSQDYPKDYFRSPLDIPLLLSGNFAELRSNHFHTGLDILTQGVEGKKLYAIADGYVSRINISPWGYGMVVYIDHPNGYTSVYAHMSAFSAKLDSVYREGQKQAKKSILDMFPDPGKVPVKKGEVIGLSGNTGLSAGPHLHFEIRETKTEKPVNPLLFGFDIKDESKPVLKGLRVYRFPHDSASGHCDKSHVVAGSDGSYYVRDGAQITVSGTDADLFGVAIHAVDYLTGSPGVCGVYRIKLFLDDMLIFEQETQKLDFNTNRYMNAHTDFANYQASKQSYHRSFLLANNKLEIYRNLDNRGLFVLENGKVHQLRYEVYDFHGNVSKLAFQLRRVASSAITESNGKMFLYPNTENHIDNDAFQVYLPPASVYNAMPFSYSVGSKPAGGWSPVVRIMDKTVPVQPYWTLKIKSSVPERLKDKCVMASYEGGKITGNVDAVWQNGWVSAELRTFGEFAVLVDSIAPVITPINISNGKNMSANTEIGFTLQDNLSGIGIFDLEIDGEWIPMDFDPRKSKYSVQFSDLNLSRGEHKLVLTVHDDRGNTSTWSGTFIR
jgi:hypothetical protein